MVTLFWPKHNKSLKMGSKCQIFTSLRTRITIISDLKCIMMVKEIPRNGVIRCIEIAPNDKNVNFNNVIIFIDRITKWEVYMD